MKEYLQVGAITSAHGIKGEMKVFPTTDDPERFRDLKKVLLETKEGWIPLEIQGVKFLRSFLLLKFRGIDSASEAEKYRGKSLFVPRRDAVKLKKDEYYMADLIGMRVVTDKCEKGVLQDVLQTGANQVYEVDFEKYGKVLIPAIHQCILDVDVRSAVMKVHLLDGMV